MRLDARTCRAVFARSRVAGLSTVDARGVPHLVPVTFAVDGDLVVVAVDRKPKSGKELRRIRNIEANPAVCLLVDHYAEDWTALWWVRADGTARVLRSDTGAAHDLLAAKYPQYSDGGYAQPDGAVLAITVHGWSGWAASERWSGDQQFR